jgi:hypothetical protein
MTPLAIIQILYLAINVIGVALGFIWLYTACDVPVIDKLLAGSSKCWVQIVLSIFEILLIALFIPAITVLTIISMLFVIIGTNFEE